MSLKNTEKSLTFSELYLNKRMMGLLCLGFASGLPLRLTASTFQAWCYELGISLATIGAINIVRMPYSLKFLWSPLLDRYPLPFLGRRKGWLLLVQVLLVTIILIASLVTPDKGIQSAVVIVFFIAFLSATQDILIDAFRAENLDQSEYGGGAAVGVFGYRLGMLFTGAFALFLADHYSWVFVYRIMACGMAVSILATLFLTKEKRENLDYVPKSLKSSIVDPLKDFLLREKAVEILFFIVLFKFGDVIAGSITTPFYLNLGFTKSDVGIIDKWVGMFAVIIGGIYGGKFIATSGLFKSLTVFSILQMVGTLLFAFLSIAGKSYLALVLSIVGENAFAGMGTAAQVALLMELCNKKYTATQYALLSSIAALSGIFAASFSGVVAAKVGWTNFFLICSLLGLPGLLLLRSRFKLWKI